ncbi:hypothetical protein [Pseudoxanthomonas sp. PXM01]|uniref:hypothetical protein n=1 Tax=Pseudoxanthomonas sp. PXM01 TaxID=2769295 RepID=UPI0017819C27|nr:hypothetical protein [Pseudoxanthomonas sp. PXM01]MBD9471255.1 hypothetical protein [Pseudoxanthomonas sp. PXM01]
MISFSDMRQLAPGAAHAPERFDWAFAAPPFDDRGRRSLDLVRASADQTLEVSYEPETFRIQIGPNSFRASDLQGIREAFPGNMLLLDATSLDAVEMLVLTTAFLRPDHNTRQLGFIYAEPERYRPSSDAVGMELAFNFAARFRGIKSVPGFASELREDEHGRLVACLGFEADRLDRILQDDDGTFIRHSTLVFGVPPYRTTWEMHALLPHEKLIRQRMCEVAFAGANNPKAAYECLKAAFQATADDERLIIAPLGSKPSSIGMALFACCRENIRLKYDFPVRQEGGTEGVGVIHRYLVGRQ